ncbi:MAG: hypothetical protein M3463_09455 [Verrucomicrobiota bacterium]|nr:hypothetical protein [Verrucomicrobiota bacterium]
MTNTNSCGPSRTRARALGQPIFLAALGSILGTLCAQTKAPPPAAQSLVPRAEVTAEGGFNFYNIYQGKRMRSLAISPQGSLIAGGLSKGKEAPLTNDPPTIDPVAYDKAGAGGGRNWIHDFYFGRYVPGEGQPRLHTRGLIMWGRGDSPDVQMGRTGPDNPKTMYGPPEDTAPGTSLGKLIFTAWGEGQFQGDIAGMYARNEIVATGTRNPGSLHLGTAGASTGNNAWRDMIDRLVIASNGYVAIGDEFPNPSERLHVRGNILAEGNITASGEVVARGAKKFAIPHPCKEGRTLIHAAIEGPEAAVYYRGEAKLANGRAVVPLPEYFEALARAEGRTVMLTNVDGFDRISVQRQAGRQVANGQFLVIAENASSSQAFTWEVKAARADIAPLEIEP